MIATLLFQLEVFLFIMACFIAIIGIIHTVSVFRLKDGKLYNSESNLALFGASIAYILTMLICGF
jgi:uncharacterized membrane protein YidH (DUF202 family)